MLLSVATRRQLQEVLQNTRDGNLLRRSQALLWVDQGESVASVARRLRISRWAVYRWMQWLQQPRSGDGIVARLCDQFRPGRPPHKRRAAEQAIREVVETTVDPRTLGYRSPIWTAPLLRHYLKWKHKVRVSVYTIRRCLRALQYRHKRPRYVLSRRSPTWRQAKGGSKEA